MEVQVNWEEFDELQRYLAGEIVATVHNALKDLKLPRSQLTDVINNIAFNVCCAIDGSTIMEHKGRPLIPVLTFSESSDFNRVISNGSTSFMHEYVHGTTSQQLGE
jgi:hypothetical protein